MTELEDPDFAGIAAWVQDGDRTALEAVFERHADAALRLATRRLGNVSDAEDAVQHAFVGVMKGARSIRPGAGSVRGYIFASVVNACAQQRRAEGSRRAREAVLAAAEHIGADPDIGDAVREALAQLPEHQRQPVELRYLGGLDFPEIAAALGRNERTVRGQVARGLDTLRQVCGRLGLAATATSLVVALGALPGPAHGAEAVARCVGIAARGPRLPRVAALRAWWTSGAVAVVAIVVGAAAFAPGRTEHGVTASPPAATAPAAIGERRLSRVDWDVAEDEAAGAALPFLALGAARGIDDDLGVGVAWWEGSTREDWWSESGKSHRVTRSDWLPQRMLRAARPEDECYLICFAPTSEPERQLSLVARSVIRTSAGWRVVLDGMRASRASFSGRLAPVRNGVAFPLGRLVPGRGHVEVEVRWREVGADSAVYRDQITVEGGALELPIAPADDDGPATLVALEPRGGAMPRTATGWWQMEMLQKVVEGDAPDSIGGLIGSSPAWATFYRGGPTIAGISFQVLGPRMTRDDGITLRSIHWNGSVVTITVALWLRRDQPADAERRRPQLLAWVERPPELDGLATVELVWEHFVALDDSGTYVLQSEPPPLAGVTRLEGIDLPSPSLPDPEGPAQ